MKREYVAPTMICEEFAANEYVAACGEQNQVYKFKCDAGDGWSGDVYIETNGEDGLQTGRKGDTYLSGYHACDIEHEAKTTDAFLNGYYLPDWSDKIVPVIIWRGPKGDNTHCTTNVKMHEWETDKS